MKGGLDTYPTTLQKRESLDDSATNATVEKHIPLRRSYSTADSLLISKDAIKHTERSKEVSNASKQTPQDAKNPKLDDLAIHLTQNFLLEKQQKVLLKKLAERNRDLEILS